MNNIKHFFFFLSFFWCNLYSHETFQYTTVDSGALSNETQITCFEDNSKIGFVSYTKVPCSYFYVIHSFYVYPEYRCQGYGEKLLKQACEHVKALHASRIYIQPGPFEIINGYTKNIHGQDRKKRMQSLVKLYSKCDFTGVDLITMTLACLAYKIMNIDEDTDYLMVKRV